MKLNRVESSDESMWLEAAVSKMRGLIGGDEEASHIPADELLCDALRRLGAGKLVDEYNKIDKWYS